MGAATPTRRTGAHVPPAHTAPRAKAAAAAPAKVGSVQDEAVAIRIREDEGAFGEAAHRLRALRRRTPPDADLELALALDEARSGAPDSAWQRLFSPLLRAALADTGTAVRWQPYGKARPLQWIDGKYTGWYWYIAHARAELALERSDWGSALEAARIAVHAQPLVGREHLLLAIAAGRAGEADEARRAAETAAALDPLLPEADYLAGIWAWRSGQRTAARAHFEEAIAADSSDRDPALALVRLRLPGSRPDSLPAGYLTSVRRAAMLTAPNRPKPEEDVVTDTPAGLYGQVAPSWVVPDSLRPRMHMTRPIRLYVTVLVDERGRAALSYFPWFSAAGLAPEVLEHVMAEAKTWRFRPATRFQAPVRAWVSVEYWLNLPS
jgi:Flp pilus assembly protein TadD